MINGNIRKILGIFLIIGVCLSLLGCTTENKDIQSNNVSNDNLIIKNNAGYRLLQVAEESIVNSSEC